MNKRRTRIAKKQYLMAVAAIFLIVLIIFGVTRAFSASDTNKKSRSALAQVKVGCQNLDLFNIPNVARKANHIIVCSYKFRIDVIRIVVDRKFSYVKIAVFIRRDGIQILERKI